MPLKGCNLIVFDLLGIFLQGRDELSVWCVMDGDLGQHDWLYGLQRRHRE